MNKHPNSKELVQAMAIIRSFCNDQTKECSADKCPFFTTKGVKCILSNGAPLEWEIDKNTLKAYEDREDKLNKKREAIHNKDVTDAKISDEIKLKAEKVYKDILKNLLDDGGDPDRENELNKRKEAKKR